jgi:hypothetical protein
MGQPLYCVIVPVLSCLAIGLMLYSFQVLLTFSMLLLQTAFVLNTCGWTQPFVSHYKYLQTETSYAQCLHLGARLHVSIQIHTYIGFQTVISGMRCAPFRECEWGALTRDPNSRLETALRKSRSVSEGFMLNGQ